MAFTNANLSSADFTRAKLLQCSFFGAVFDLESRGTPLIVAYRDDYLISGHQDRR